MIRNLILAFGAAMLFSACATQETSAPVEREKEARPLQPSAVNSRPSPISISDVKNRLNMNRARQELGYREGRFNRCDFSSRQNCGDDFLVTIHFQLLCRESEGTVDSISSAELIPVRADGIRWTLGPSSGTTRTDHQGYGQVEVVRPYSAGRERLKLTIDRRFVATPANETERIVVPENWCPKAYD